METLLAGAGGCTAYDVVLILKKGRHDVRGCHQHTSCVDLKSDDHLGHTLECAGSEHRDFRHCVPLRVPTA